MFHTAGVLIPNDAFEGTISNGAVLLAVETDQKDLQHLAMECFSNNGAAEIIARAETVGPLPAVSVESTSDTTAANLQLAD